MAYDAAGLSLMSGTLGGQFNVWCYRSLDPFATVDNTDYFTLVDKRGVKDGDFIFVVDTDAGPPPDITLAYFTIDADGNGTLTAVAFAGAGAFTTLAATGLATLEDIAHGTDGTSLLGFYGDTPIARPAAAAQSVVPTTAITTAISTLVTGTFGFVTSEQGDAVVAAVNSLIARVAANTTLVNAIRAALITSTGLGLIKGAA